MIPLLPDVPAEHRASARGPLRYEDVSQDGRLLLTALPHFMGLAVFQGLFIGDAFARATARAGIVPIVTRLVVDGGGGPVSVRKPVEITGGFELAHTVDDAGEVNRLIMNAFSVMTAPIGRTNPPSPPNAGQTIEVGRVFVEHVYTRPFAPREQRKVLRFDPGPWPAVPPARQTWRPPAALLELPAGAQVIDETLEPDDAVTIFGLAHTDSNQHVNSLVYPRLFEEAVLRRLAARGLPASVLGRAVEIAYRKPCFAGQQGRFHLALHRADGKIAARGVFVADGETLEKPNVTIRIEMG